MLKIMINLYDEILNIIYSTYWDYSLKPVGYRSLDSELVSSINLIARDKAYLCLFNVSLGFWLWWVLSSPLRIKVN